MFVLLVAATQQGAEGGREETHRHRGAEQRPGRHNSENHIFNDPVNLHLHVKWHQWREQSGKVSDWSSG